MCKLRYIFKRTSENNFKKNIEIYYIDTAFYGSTVAVLLSKDMHINIDVNQISVERIKYYWDIFVYTLRVVVILLLVKY